MLIRKLHRGYWGMVITVRSSQKRLILRWARYGIPLTTQDPSTTPPERRLQTPRPGPAPAHQQDKKGERRSPKLSEVRSQILRANPASGHRSAINQQPTMGERTQERMVAHSDVGDRGKWRFCATPAIHRI